MMIMEYKGRKRTALVPELEVRCRESKHELKRSGTDIHTSLGEAMRILPCGAPTSQEISRVSMQDVTYQALHPPP